MTRKRKTGVPVVLAFLVLATGCLSGGVGDAPSSPTTETPTPTEGPGTQTQVGTEWASEQPDPNKEVNLENRWNKSAEMRVSVIRDETNETVHNDTYTLDPGEDRTVYNVSEADPNGIESFTVAVTAQNTTERISIKTNKCYGDSYAEIQDDGSLYLYYAIC